MEISLFRNLEKHTVVDPSQWVPEQPQPVVVPVNQELKRQVGELHEQVSNLAANVRTMRREVVSNVEVLSLAEQLGADDLDVDMEESNDGSGRGERLVADSMPDDLLTRDMLRRLKTNVDTLVTTTEGLRTDVPLCLAVSQRELRAVTQVLKDNSNVDQAMARSGHSPANRGQRSGLEELSQTPRGTIRGLLAAEHAKSYENGGTEN
jgi:hypothetical protein